MRTQFKALREVYNPYSPYMPYEDRYDIQQQPEINAGIKGVDRSQANLEAERGEVVVKPDLSGIYGIAGKRHYSGGTPLSLPSGSFIFSDDKDLHITPEEKQVFKFKGGGIVGKSKNTPARVIKREVNLKHYNASTNILTDRNFDDISKKSATLMLQGYHKKLGQVAFVQEAKKGFPAGIPPFAAGSAPVVDPRLQAQLTQNKQYMQLGGVTNTRYFNPYTPKMMSFQLGGPNNASFFDPSYDFPGGIPPDRTGKWAGDYAGSRNPLTGQTSTNWNAMTHFGSPQGYAQAIGYTGSLNPTDPSSIRRMQQWAMGQYPDIVNKYHSSSQYGMPTAGRPDDGRLGVRWDAIGQDIQRGPQLPNPGAFPDAPPGPTPPATPGSPAAQSQPPGPGLTPNPYTGGNTLPYRPNIPLSPLQKANMLYAGYQAMSVPRYQPMRSQVKSPLVELNRYNPTAALTAVSNSASEAYANNRAQNPYLSGLNNAAIYGKSLEAKTQVLGDYENRNVGVGNQQAEQNNQIQRQDMMFNTEANQRYYDQTQQLAQNYNTEKRAATNQAVGLTNQYLSQNQALEQMLASQRTYGKVQIGTDKNGQPVYQSKPLYDVDTRGISPYVYYTGAGSLNGITNYGNRLQDLQAGIAQLKAAGIDVNSAAAPRYLAAIGRANPLEMPYMYNSPYGGGYGGGNGGGPYKKGGMYGWMKSLYTNPYASRF